MIIFALKLLKSLRTAIAGRKYPHQLAGAVAFGALLGIVPHGNLLALAILIVVLSLHVNHAMAGLTAVGVSFAASRLDTYSHEVGNFVLTHPDVSEAATRAWQLPVVPWTDLNNTIVMGSFLMGVASIIPIFMLTYPVFRIFAPTEKEETEQAEQETKHRNRDVAKHSIVLVQSGHQDVPAPHADYEAEPVTARDADHSDETDSIVANAEETDDDATIAVDFSHGMPSTIMSPHFAASKTPTATEIDAVHEADDCVSVETRIDVIRMKDYREDEIPEVKPATATVKAEAETPPPPMDEALNYLLRQLRDSQQRKAG